MTNALQLSLPRGVCALLTLGLRNHVIDDDKAVLSLYGKNYPTVASPSDSSRVRLHSSIGRSSYRSERCRAHGPQTRTSVRKYTTRPPMISQSSVPAASGPIVDCNTAPTTDLSGGYCTRDERKYVKTALSDPAFERPQGELVDIGAGAHA